MTDAPSLAFPSLLRGRFIPWALCAIGAAEVISYAGYVFPSFGSIAWIVIVMSAFVISLIRIEVGLWFILAELAIGSKGYLFHMTIAGVPVSIRFGIFAAVLAAWGVALLRRRIPTRALVQDARWTIPVIAAIAWGIVLGLAHERNARLLFLDANGYLFFGLLPIFLTALNDRGAVRRALQVLIAAVSVSVVMTLLMVYAFSHQFPDVLPGLYRWVRDTGVGEITLLRGNVYRIFFQSHLYTIALFLLGTAALVWRDPAVRRRDFRLCAFLIGACAVFIVGLSRSFWIGAVVAFATLTVLLWRRGRLRLLAIGQWFVTLLGIGAIAVVATYGIIVLPIPAATPGASPTAFAERVGDLTTEAAAVSRWQLAVPLLKAISVSPVFGSGFGTTVTYHSADPRVVAATGGIYTTYAFEWGYLDLWLKIGIIGVASYGFLLWAIGRDGLRLLRDPLHTNDRAIVLGMFAVLIFLVATHAVSPYLNHPLGIGLVMLLGTTFRTLLRHPEPS